MANLQNLKAIAVLPAAGCGERFASAVPKQYTIIKGKPLLCYALEGLLRIDCIEKIILVVDNVESAHALLQPYFAKCFKLDFDIKVNFVKGSSSRHRSILAGLEHIASQAYPHVVLVHDAVRPFIPVNLVDLIEAAFREGAASYVRPLVSTVIKPRNDENVLEQVLQRDLYRASETPQAFRWKILWEAYKQADDEELDKGTECLQLALKYGQVAARLLPGGEKLWKVTYPKDLVLAKEMLTGENVVLVEGPSMGGAKEEVVAGLRTQFARLCLSRTEISQRFQQHVIFCKCFADFNLLACLEALDSSEHGNLVMICTKDNLPEVCVSEMAEIGEKYVKSVYLIQFNAAKGKNLFTRLVNLVRTLVTQTDSALSGQCFRV